jgi:hypothetical protein
MRLIIRDTQDKAAQYIADYIFIKELAFWVFTKIEHH